MQKPLAVVGNAILPTPLSCIEVERPIVRKLTQLCTEHQIPIKELASNLLQRMLLDHHKESKQIVENLRCKKNHI